MVTTSRSMRIPLLAGAVALVLLVVFTTRSPPNYQPLGGTVGSAGSRVGAVRGVSAHGITGQSMIDVLRHSVRVHPDVGGVPASRSVPRHVSRKLNLRAYSGEKKEPEFFPAKISSVEEAATGVYTVKVESDRAQGQYSIPGQFTQIRVGDSKPGFFAVSNRPGDESLEFLIKKVDGTAGLLTDLKSGDSLEMTDIMGKGFPWERVADNAKYKGGTYVFATGTGFGPIKAMIESGTFKGRTGMKIYYGARDPSHMACKEQFQTWFQQGLLGDSPDMPIIPVYSCAAQNSDEEKSYVQDVAVLSTDGIDPSTASAIICGHWDMTNILKEKLADFGMPSENILTNF